MPITRPFAYNSGSAIPGTTQVGSLAVGVTEQDYSSSPGGVTWWMGPDEDPGYVVAYYENGVPNAALGGPAVNHPTFSRSLGKTEVAFYRMVERINPAVTGSQDAVNWLNNNGYWHNYDGVYTSSVKIGNQIWTSANLDVVTYRNGDPIEFVSSANSSRWSTMTTGGYTYVNGSSANTADHGLLYNHYAVTDPRGIGPVGWHIPTDTEMFQLAATVDPNYNPAGPTLVSSTAGAALKASGTTYWLSPNTGATNSSGFGARGSGLRFSGGTYGSYLAASRIWTTSLSGSNGIYWGMASNTTELSRFGANRRTGASVRLVMD